MALEVAERIEESIPYCERAIALSKSCLQRLKEEIVNAAVSNRSQVSEKEEEVEVVIGFQSELERKVTYFCFIIKKNTKNKISSVG